MNAEIQESFEKTRLAGSIASGALDEVSKIIRPGIPNIQPWKIGIRPPMIPIITKMIPTIISSECFSNYRLIMRGRDKIERKYLSDSFKRWQSKNPFTN